MVHQLIRNNYTFNAEVLVTGADGFIGLHLLELNKFEQAGLLSSELEGNRKYFRANTEHPLFSDIHNILLKHIGFDEIIERVINKLGNLDIVYIAGDFARGINTQIIDLIFVGDNINKEYLIRLVEKTESFIKRKIRYLVLGDNGS